MATEHPQMPICAGDEVIFTVDEELQTLIQYLFDRGVVTFNSCQDNVNNTCWIQYDLFDWMTLSDLAFNSSCRDLYEFIETACDVRLLSFDDGDLDEDNDEWIEGENLIWSASVRFDRDSFPDFERMIVSTCEEFDFYFTE